MKSLAYSSLIAAIVAGSATLSHAGGLKYTTEDGDYLKLGGRIQVQYHRVDPDGGETTDDLLFRRLRPYIEGSLNEDWKGKWQFDLGKSKTEVKDAYFQYKGHDAANVAVGNKTFPYSREQLTSSKKQAAVERSAAGDHNYGSPDRQVGIHLDGGGDLVTWGAALVMAALDPSNSKLDFDSVASLNAGSDWIEGPMVGARAEIHPMGPVTFEQGALGGDSELQLAFGVGAFSWENDEDVVNTVDVTDGMGMVIGSTTSSKDVDSVTGFEISGSARVAGLSVDAQFNSFDSETVVDGVTSGIYKDGETTFDVLAVEAGYTVIPETLELILGFSSLDADGYAKTWERTEVGLNLYVDKHDIKHQVTYRMNENKDGKDGSDVDELFVQSQFVF